MDVRWDGPPPVERIRAAASSRLSGVSVVAAHDRSGSNEVLISVETGPQQDLTAIRQTIADALSTVGTHYAVRSFEAIGPQIGADLRRQALLAAGRRFGRHAPVPGVAVPTRLWRGRSDGDGSRRVDHGRHVLVTAPGSLADGCGCPADIDRLFHERHHRGLRPYPRKSPCQRARATGRNHQPQYQPDAQPDIPDFRIDTADGALALLLFGGPVLHGFSLVLVIGIIVGTFSSIFVASPILLAWEQARAERGSPTRSYFPREGPMNRSLFRRSLLVLAVVLGGAFVIVRSPVQLGLDLRGGASLILRVKTDGVAACSNDSKLWSRRARFWSAASTLTDSPRRPFSPMATAETNCWCNFPASAILPASRTCCKAGRFWNGIRWRRPLCQPG